MTVSKLTAETLPAAAALTQALFPHEHWGEADLMGEYRTFFGAVENGRVVGCGGLQTIGEQGDILTVGVDPAHRQKGIGNALLEAMLAVFRQQGGRELFLEVRASNEPARRLYEKQGFAPISIRKNYYQAPLEDAVIYRYEVQE